MEREKEFIERVVKRGETALNEFIEREGVPTAIYGISYSERGWEKILCSLDKIVEYAEKQNIKVYVDEVGYNTLCFQKIIK